MKPLSSASEKSFILEERQTYYDNTVNSYYPRHKKSNILGDRKPGKPVIVGTSQRLMLFPEPQWLITKNGIKIK